MGEKANCSTLLGPEKTLISGLHETKLYFRVASQFAEATSGGFPSVKCALYLLESVTWTTVVVEKNLLCEQLRARVAVCYMSQIRLNLRRSAYLLSALWYNLLLSLSMLIGKLLGSIRNSACKVDMLQEDQTPLIPLIPQ